MTSGSAVVDKWEVYLLLSTTGQLVSPSPTLFIFLFVSLPPSFPSPSTYPFCVSFLFFFK